MATTPTPIDPASLFTDPLQQTNVDFIANSCTLTVFIANVVVWVIRSIFIVMIVYNVAIAIQKVSMGDAKEDFDHLRTALTNAVFSALGVIIVVSSFFLPCTFLKLLGVKDAQNIFCNGFTCPTTVSQIGGAGADFSGVGKE